MKVVNPIALFLDFTYVKNFLLEKNDTDQKSAVFSTIVWTILIVTFSLTNLIYNFIPAQSILSASTSFISVSLSFILLYHAFVLQCSAVYMHIISPYFQGKGRETYKNLLGFISRQQMYILLLSIAIYYQAPSFFIPFFLFSSWLAIRVQTKAITFLRNFQVNRSSFLMLVIHLISAIGSAVISFVF